MNPDVLKWAIEESGFSVPELAGRVKVPVEAVSGWINGEETPTQGQFTLLAKALRRPASIFFLPERPMSSGLPPKLRRATGSTERDLDGEELKEIRRARRTQRLIGVLNREDGRPPVTIPAFTTVNNPEEAGAALRAWLQVSLASQYDWKSGRVAFDAWRKAIESQNVLVMQLQLGSRGLRGFCLADENAPLIAVNSAENLKARIFTMLHELAHLASATDTACLQGVNASQGDNSTEKWCDRVASSVLLPRNALVQARLEIVGDSDVTFAALRRLADRFNASLRATAVALIRFNLAGSSLYDEVESEAPGSDYDKGFARGQPQYAPARRLGEIGPLAVSAVLDALAAERLTERDARDYLRLDGTEIAELGAALKASQ